MLITISILEFLRLRQLWHLYSLHGWFLGMQNAKYPLYVALFVNLLNIVLNLIFVYQFNMKVEGVAWGTLIAQYSGVIFTILTH